MNAPFTRTPTEVAHTDALIAALVAYRAIAERRPDICRFGHEYLAVLDAMNDLEGRDALLETLEEARADLEPCEDCRRVNCSCDDGFFSDEPVRYLGNGRAQVSL